MGAVKTPEMTDQRERLVELIAVSSLAKCPEMLADLLLANGVVLIPCRCRECASCPTDEKYNIYEQAVPCPMWEDGDSGWGACWHGELDGFCYKANKKGGDDL